MSTTIPTVPRRPAPVADEFVRLDPIPAPNSRSGPTAGRPVVPRNHHRNDGAPRSVLTRSDSRQGASRGGAGEGKAAGRLHQGLLTALAFVLILPVCFAGSGEPDPERLERFQRLLSNPPIIRELLYVEKLPPVRDRPPPLDRGIQDSTQFATGLLSWQPGAMAFRALAHTNSNAQADRTYAGLAFWFRDDTMTFLEGPTNVLVYRMEHNRVQHGEFPPTYDAATYRLRRQSEPLSLGLSHLLPGSVQWDGLRFTAVGSADKQPIYVSGAITGYTNGIPNEMKVFYTKDSSKTPVSGASYRIAYTYDRWEPPWFPSQITLYFQRGTREIEYRSYRILSVVTSDKPLPAEVFDPFRHLSRDQVRVTLATNDSHYVVLPGGALLQASGGATPKARLTAGDVYRNRYAYLAIAAVNVGFGVCYLKTRRKERNLGNPTQL